MATIIKVGELLIDTRLGFTKLAPDLAKARAEAVRKAKALSPIEIPVTPVAKISPSMKRDFKRLTTEIYEKGGVTKKTAEKEARILLRRDPRYYETRAADVAVFKEKRRAAKEIEKIDLITMGLRAKEEDKLTSATKKAVSDRLKEEKRGYAEVFAMEREAATRRRAIRSLAYAKGGKHWKDALPWAERAYTTTAPEDRDMLTRTTGAERRRKESKVKGGQFVMSYLKRAIWMIGIFGTARFVGRQTADAIKLGMRYEDLAEKTHDAFGIMSQSMTSWSRTTSKSLGLNSYEFQELNNDMGYTLRTLGMGAKEAATYTQMLSKRAADLSAYKRIPLEHAVEAMKKGAMGLTRQFQALGIKIDESLDIEFNKTKTTKRVVDEKNKALEKQLEIRARIKAMMDATAVMEGKMFLEGRKPEMQQRAFLAQWTSSKAAFGEHAAPAWGTFLEWSKNNMPKEEGASKLGIAVKGIAETYFGKYPFEKGPGRSKWGADPRMDEIEERFKADYAKRTGKSVLASGMTPGEYLKEFETFRVTNLKNAYTKQAKEPETFLGESWVALKRVVADTFEHPFGIGLKGRGRDDYFQEEMWAKAERAGGDARMLGILGQERVMLRYEKERGLYEDRLAKDARGEDAFKTKGLTFNIGGMFAETTGGIGGGVIAGGASVAIARGKDVDFLSEIAANTKVIADNFGAQ